MHMLLRTGCTWDDWKAPGDMSASLFSDESSLSQADRHASAAVFCTSFPACNQGWCTTSVIYSHRVWPGTKRVRNSAAATFWVIERVKYESKDVVCMRRQSWQGLRSLAPVQCADGFGNGCQQLQRNHHISLHHPQCRQASQLPGTDMRQ